MSWYDAPFDTAYHAPLSHTQYCAWFPSVIFQHLSIPALLNAHARIPTGTPPRQLSTACIHPSGAPVSTSLQPSLPTPSHTLPSPPISSFVSLATAVCGLNTATRDLAADRRHMSPESVRPFAGLNPRLNRCATLSPRIARHGCMRCCSVQKEAKATKEGGTGSPRHKGATQAATRDGVGRRLKSEAGGKVSWTPGSTEREMSKNGHGRTGGWGGGGAAAGRERRQAGRSHSGRRQGRRGAPQLCSQPPSGKGGGRGAGGQETWGGGRSAQADWQRNATGSDESSGGKQA